VEAVLDCGCIANAVRVEGRPRDGPRADGSLTELWRFFICMFTDRQNHRRLLSVLVWSGHTDEAVLLMLLMLFSPNIGPSQQVYYRADLSTLETHRSETDAGTMGWCCAGGAGGGALGDRVRGRRGGARAHDGRAARAKELRRTEACASDAIHSGRPTAARNYKARSWRCGRRVRLCFCTFRR
jgi:hypothetical protein